MYLCIEFQEAYKRLDSLCKDCYGSDRGVSEYIKQMDTTSWNERKNVFSWDEDYKQLKHIRWVRNQLAHEIGTLESEICTEHDLSWTNDFYQKILSGNDPLTLARKIKPPSYTKSPPTRTQTPTSFPSSSPRNTVQPNTSWFQKILKKLKQWLGT